MDFYIYRGNYELGQEPCGSDGRFILRNKTERFARKEAKRIYGDNCRIFRFTNFYDDKTFTEVK